MLRLTTRTCHIGRAYHIHPTQFHRLTPITTSLKLIHQHDHPHTSFVHPLSHRTFSYQSPQYPPYQQQSTPYPSYQQHHQWQDPRYTGGMRMEYDDDPRYNRRRNIGKTLLWAGLTVYLTVTTYHLLTEHDSWQYQVIRHIPYRIISRTWGWIHNKELPFDWIKRALYGAWIYLFDVNMSEAANQNLLSYPNLAQFFTRPLRQGVRPISSDPLVSPVDALVTVIGEVTPDGKLDHIKGMSYALPDMLGMDPLKLVAHVPILPPDTTQHPTAPPTRKLYYCVLYLAPGDYHRIHSPTEMSLTHRMHFPGDLYPVSPSIARYVTSLFTRNERVALYGTWEYGFFSMTAVGALNVGGIKLAIEPEVITNRSWQRPGDLSLREAYGRGTGGYLRDYGKMDVDKGAEVARFELGSTVVLVFETAQHGFEFGIKEGQRVKVGQSLGHVVPLANAKPP